MVSLWLLLSLCAVWLSLAAKVDCDYPPGGITRQGPRLGLASAFLNKQYSLVLAEGHYTLHTPSRICALSMLPAAHLVVEEEHLPLRDIVNPVARDASNQVKLAEIARLTQENLPIVAMIVKEMTEELGTFATYNFKQADRIVDKAERPSILAEKPWHGIEHVRDTLRFKARLTQLSDIPRIVQIVLRHGVTIVKIDADKLIEPKNWGWRFIGFDFRFPNGQLVEFYAPPLHLDIPAVKKPNHELFELWRYVHPSELEEGKSAVFLYEEAVLVSRQRYDEAFDEFLRVSGYNNMGELQEAWAGIADWSDLDSAHKCPAASAGDAVGDVQYMLAALEALTTLDDEVDEDGDGDPRDPRADPIVLRLILSTLRSAEGKKFATQLATTAPDALQVQLKRALLWVVDNAELNDEHAGAVQEMMSALP
jgi:hypothetical protein